MAKEIPLKNGSEYHQNNSVFDKGSNSERSFKLPSIKIQKPFSAIPKKRTDVIKWNGWGYNDSKFVVKDGIICFTGKRYPIGELELPYFTEWAKKLLNVDPFKSCLPCEIPFDDFFPKTTINADFLCEIINLKIDHSLDGFERLTRSHGQTLHDIYSLRRDMNSIHRIPDIVLWPYSDFDDTSYVRNTRSRARLHKSRKTQMKVKKNTPATIDLTDQVPQTSKKKTLVIDGDINITVDDDSDDELEENIRVMWTQSITEVKRFFLKPSQNFRCVFEDLSNTFNIPAENIRIRNKDRIISMYDILKSLNLKVTDVLEAYAIEENTEDCKTFSTDKIEVKCLLQNSKRPLVFYVHPEQNFSCLLESCAKEINCSTDHLEMKFDGYKVSPDDTPLSLDLEGGECLEVHIMQ